MKTLCQLKCLFVVCIFTCLLTFMTARAAPYQAYIKTDGVNLRENPTTKNSSILGSMSTGNVITIVDDNKIEGTGCSAGWYKVTFNGTDGYVCSQYVTTERIEDKYMRPWNSPYKAIVGGAIYISNGYISKGQFTSYLKKFNVNPDGHYAIYNHQYQTNIAAPSSEAYSSWRAYDKAGYMKTGSESFPFIFTIPVYNNMADAYKVEGVTGANLSTSDITDDAFEIMIKDFPDSYKPYLRDLHQDHPNWIFKPMITNLDFEAAAAIEKEVGAVQNTKMRYVDSNGKNIVTEAGWYKPTEEATRYYMDPRNWLNETYVFMFEDLSYNEQISENVVRSILYSKTLLMEYDPVDHKTYTSIFMEAGKKANINPAYLASLSIIEIGTRNVNGAQFEYEGVTYSGLYNFYNIGAYSSASNPTSAGLVFASGGVCTICNTYTGEETTPVVDPEPKPIEEPIVEPEPKEEPKEEQKEETKYGDITKLGVKVNGDKVSGFKLGTKISDLQAKDNNIKFSNNDIIKTGTVINTGNKTYTAVVYGDVSGDGEIDITDLLTIRLYLLKKKSLSGAYLEAGKLTSDTVDITSLLKIRLYLLGKQDIKQG